MKILMKNNQAMFKYGVLGKDIYTLPENGLICYYDFNNQTGTTDLSSYHNDATAHNTTLTTDSKGNANSAYLFNGTDSYVDASSVYDDLNYPRGTYFIRVKYTAVSNDQYLWGQYFSHGVGTASGDQPYGRWDDDDGAKYTARLSLIAGDWYDIVLVRDETAGYMKIYCNQTLIDTISAVNSTPYSNTFTIGCHYQDNHGMRRFFNGAVEKFLAYNRALSESEIIKLSNL